MVLLGKPQEAGFKIPWAPWAPTQPPTIPAMPAVIEEAEKLVEHALSADMTETQQEYMSKLLAVQ